MLLAGIHGLCGVPVGKPPVGAGGAEWEMWPSKMGELEFSTGDRDAAAAGGSMLMDRKLDGLVQAQLCQEFPSASAGVAQGSKRTFPKQFSLTAFKRAFGDEEIPGEEEIPAGFHLCSEGAPRARCCPGIWELLASKPFLKKIPQFHHREPNTFSSFQKNQCWRNDQWCKS